METKTVNYNKHTKNRLWDEERVAELDALLRSGIYISQLQDHFNVSRQRLYQIIAQHGLETKYRKTRRDRIVHGCPKIARIHRNLCNRKLHLNAESPGTFKNDAETLDLLPLPTRCPVLGIELEYSGYKGLGHSAYASIDRIDPTKGYDKGNVQIISYRANRIKNDATLEELRALVAHIESLTN